MSGNADHRAFSGELVKEIEENTDDHPGNARLQPGSKKPPARLEPGAPGVIHGWHSRGYLPHFDSHDATQHVTIHLADSLPKQVVERLERKISSLPLEQQDVERRKRVEAWIDAGHGSCVLRDPLMAEMVQSTILFFDHQRYRLFAWVVMPNHVHVLFQPMAGWTLAQIVTSWKSFTGRRISAFGGPGNATLQRGSHVTPARLEPGVPGERIWHREYWDRYIRDEVHFRQTLDYIHANPVKAGLVTRAEEWRWSSAQSYAQENPPGIARLQPGCG